MKRSLTCVLIGESSLLRACAERLVARGHRIVACVGGYVSSPATPRYDDLARAMADLAETPDVLFSIVNRRLLRPAELAWPRLAAINYHDSPLPRYAGVNAPSWAILHGETQHGITWHRMAPQVDAGELLVQRVFPIDADETALSLNVKCHEQARAGFEALLDNLERGDMAGTAQDPARRRVFTSAKRLPRQGFIVWSETAATICRAVRAGKLGPYANDFGLPKLLLPDGALLAVGRAEPVPGVVGVRGQVHAADGRSLVVSASDGRVNLTELVRITDGGRIELDSLVGQILPELSAEEASELESLDRAAAKVEACWLTALATLPPPLTPPELRPEKFPGDQGNEHVVEIPIQPGSDAREALIEAALRLAEADGRDAFSLGYLKPSAQGFARVVPLAWRAPTAAGLRAELAAVRRRPAFPLDLPMRFPALRTAVPRLAQMRVVLDDGLDAQPPRAGATTANPGLVLAARSERLVFRFAADQIAPAEAEIFARRLACGRAPQRLAAGTEETLRPESDCPVLIHRQATRHAMERPGKVAIEHGDETLTYAELEARASRLAWRLREAGAGPETRVALGFPRSIAFFVAVLGVLKSGAAYLPLDVEMPPARLREIIDDAQPLLLVCAAAFQPVARGLAVEIVFYDNAPDASAQTSASPPDYVGPGHLAYIIYTSGSSGRPKGSMIEHGALARFIARDVEAHGITADDRVLQLCSLVFDASVEELFSALTTGATLVLRPPDLLESAHRFLDFCDQARLTVIGIFAAILGDVLSAMEARGVFPARVRLATTGGESVAAADVRRWQRFFQERGLAAPPLVNVYGLTETTVANLVCNLSAADLTADAVPIGRPLPGNLVALVDERLLPVSDGEAGELLLGGPQLARAYLKRPQLNALRFTVDSATGERWFRTGDVARRLPVGDLEFLGRLDRQIKRGGFRIELEDIEHALRTAAEITQAVAIEQTTATGGRSILAFATPNVPGLETRLRARLEETLPAYMLPNQIRLLDALPLNDRGKVDRLALAALAATPDADAGEQTTPTTEDEPVFQLWREFFPFAVAGDEDRTFFQLGGDSLSALNFLLRLESRSGVLLSISTFFKEPTVAGLRRMLAATASRAEAVELLLPLRGYGSRPPIYCMPGLHGDVNEYTALAATLGDDQPVFGIRSSALAPPHRAPESIEAAAREAREIIRARHRADEHVVFGSCWSGWIAFEVARLCLQEEGRAPLVFLLDSNAADLVPGRWERVTHFARHLPGWILRRLLNPEPLKRRFLRSRPTPVPNGQDVWREHPVTRQFLVLSTCYVPSRVPDLELHVFRTQGWRAPAHPTIWSNPRLMADNGWHRWTGCKTVVHSVPGDHGTLMSPLTLGPVVRLVREITAAHFARPPNQSDPSR